MPDGYDCHVGVQNVGCHGEVIGALDGIESSCTTDTGQSDHDISTSSCSDARPVSVSDMRTWQGQ